MTDDEFIAHAFERYQARAGTQDEEARASIAERWIAGLQWADGTPQAIRDAVAMNIRGFWGHVQPLVVHITPDTARNFHGEPR